MSFKNKKFGKNSSASPTPNGSLTSGWQDDEYFQIIEGVKKIYNHKIRPLEVTYNFEGSFFRVSLLLSYPRDQPSMQVSTRRP